LARVQTWATVTTPNMPTQTYTSGSTQGRSRHWDRYQNSSEFDAKKTRLPASRVRTDTWRPTRM
jgi:hypothetical protein